MYYYLFIQTCSAKNGMNPLIVCEKKRELMDSPENSTSVKSNFPCKRNVK